MSGDIAGFFAGTRRARETRIDVDPICSGLWALAGYDPALQHFAELREATRHYGPDHRLRVALDRAIGVYLEAQCQTLRDAAEIRAWEMDQHTSKLIGDDAITAVCYHAIGTTEDPLMIEVFTYALYLGTLTGHGLAPWKKFAAVMDDLFHTLNPLVKR